MVFCVDFHQNVAKSLDADKIKKIDNIMLV